MEAEPSQKGYHGDAEVQFVPSDVRLPANYLVNYSELIEFLICLAPFSNPLQCLLWYAV